MTGMLLDAAARPSDIEPPNGRVLFCNATGLDPALQYYNMPEPCHRLIGAIWGRSTVPQMENLFGDLTSFKSDGGFSMNAYLWPRWMRLVAEYSALWHVLQAFLPTSTNGLLAGRLSSQLTIRRAWRL